ncbi:MAG: hypothetical protein GY805_25875 [Chloroflexi bacterium]|nr:hypothetical protein [Chloroflexota bacterium]
MANSLDGAKELFTKFAPVATRPKIDALHAQNGDSRQIPLQDAQQAVTNYENQMTGGKVLIKMEKV